MQLHALKSLLRSHPDRLVRLQLPDGDAIPAAYHLTEVGQASKVFIDCGGKVHSELRCVLQTWVGADRHHRLNAARFAEILDLGRAVVASEEMEVEVEFGQVQAAQYPIASWTLDGSETVVLELTSKATDCLARHRATAPEGCCSQPEAPVPNEARRTQASCCA